jgi:hypothetical protein
MAMFLPGSLLPARAYVSGWKAKETYYRGKREREREKS